jgi:hypothetical protein
MYVTSLNFSNEKIGLSFYFETKKKELLLYKGNIGYYTYDSYDELISSYDDGYVNNINYSHKINEIEIEQLETEFENYGFDYIFKKYLPMELAL